MGRGDDEVTGVSGFHCTRVQLLQIIVPGAPSGVVPQSRLWGGTLMPFGTACRDPQGLVLDHYKLFQVGAVHLDEPEIRLNIKNNDHEMGIV